MGMVLGKWRWRVVWDSGGDWRSVGSGVGE